MKIGITIWRATQTEMQKNHFILDAFKKKIIYQIYMHTSSPGAAKGGGGNRGNAPLGPVRGGGKKTN